jgi:hypothetical protein
MYQHVSHPSADQKLEALEVRLGLPAAGEHLSQTSVTVLRQRRVQVWLVLPLLDSPAARCQLELDVSKYSSWLSTLVLGELSVAADVSHRHVQSPFEREPPLDWLPVSLPLALAGRELGPSLQCARARVLGVECRARPPPKKQRRPRWYGLPRAEHTHKKHNNHKGATTRLK